MEDEIYEKYNKDDYHQKHLQDKYDLLGIPFDNIQERTRMANDDDLNKGILYGQLVGFKPIGIDCEENSKIVKYLVNMDQGDESSLAIIYGVATEELNKQKEKNKEENKKDNDPITYLVREWVSGHGYTNGEDLFEKDIHDRLVLLYRLIKQIKYIHDKQIPYIFLRPNKIIVTIDMDIKLMDFIKVDQYVVEKIKKDIERKNGNVSNQHRFLYPEIFKKGFKLEDSIDPTKKEFKLEDSIEIKNLIGDRNEDEKKLNDIESKKIKSKERILKRLEDVKKNNPEEIFTIQDYEEQLEQIELDLKWIDDVKKKKNNNKNTDHDQEMRRKNEENYENEYSGSSKKEHKIFHRRFARFRKFDLWSIGCLIYYSLKEEYPWVDFIRNNEVGKRSNCTLKTADEIYDEFCSEMKKKPEERYFFINKDDINKDDLKKDDPNERKEVDEIARKCLSGEIKSIDEIIGTSDDTNEKYNDPFSEGKDQKSNSSSTPYFRNLKIWNDLKNGEVHYDFNTGNGIYKFSLCKDGLQHSGTSKSL